MEQLQKERFNEQLEEILGEDFTCTTKWEKEKLTDAKVNVNKELKGWEISALDGMANAWFFKNIEVARSGAGLVIRFIEFQGRPVAP